jgi:adenylate cyclase
MAATTGWVATAASRVVRIPGLGRRATAVAIAVTTRLVVANAVAAGFVVTYLTLTEDIRPGETWGTTIAANAIAYAAAVLVFGAASLVRGKRLFARSWTWLDDGTRPTPDEVRVLLRQPLRIGLFPLRYWATAAVLTVALDVAVGSSAHRSLFVVVVVLQGGVVAALLGFLLGDRALRPVFAEALAGSPPESPAMLGAGSRLVLTFALGAGVPLAGIVLTPFVAPDADLDESWAMGWLAVVGLVSGFTTMVIAARSFTHPVAEVRRALARVGAGDLDTSVVVDDPSELGQLQASVNDMVAHLRARAELEDLFGRHVGEPVARQALERGAQLGGEVRCISALFVDITNSTGLARRRGAEEVVALLNRFFAVVAAACDAEDGWLDDYQGDGAMCVWGAPADQADHATRALRAARLLAADLAALRRELPDLDAGIGVATGDVVAGNVGTERRLEYTVIGPAVNTAARLTVAAKGRPGRLLADAGAVATASPEERRWWQPGDPVDLAGLEPGLAVFEPSLSGR